jgi:hypothetical protein
MLHTIHVPRTSRHLKRGRKVCTTYPKSRLQVDTEKDADAGMRLASSSTLSVLPFCIERISRLARMNSPYLNAIWNKEASEEINFVIERIGITNKSQGSDHQRGDESNIMLRRVVSKRDLINLSWGFHGHNVV